MDFHQFVINEQRRALRKRSFVFCDDAASSAAASTQLAQLQPSWAQDARQFPNVLSEGVAASSTDHVVQKIGVGAFARDCVATDCSRCARPSAAVTVYIISYDAGGVLLMFRASFGCIFAVLWLGLSR